MNGVRRWQFRRLDTGEVWTVPINPNTMTDPKARDRVFQHVNYDRNGRFRTFETPGQIVEWEFGGVIHTQDHHDQLLQWAQVPTTVEITDHLNRTWAVTMRTFEPVERRPTPLKPWRFTYTMRALVLRRVA